MMRPEWGWHEQAHEHTVCTPSRAVLPASSQVAGSRKGQLGKRWNVHQQERNLGPCSQQSSSLGNFCQTAFSSPDW